LDELRAQTALARQMVLGEDLPDGDQVAGFLLWILNTYFLIGTACSDPREEHPEYWRGKLEDRHLAILEAEQARLEDAIELPPAFIVSASSPVAAQVDVARAVARRFERAVVQLKEAEPSMDATVILRFANRLSDFLFVLARYLDNEHLVVDYGVLENG
jgi:cob(I)alamin adenosyltransferase